MSTDMLGREIKDGYVVVLPMGRGDIQLAVIVNALSNKRLCMWRMSGGSIRYASRVSTYMHSNTMLIIIEEDLPSDILKHIQDIQCDVNIGIYKHY